MLLVDKNIKELANAGKLIISGYNEKNVNCVSYDITVKSIVHGDDEIQSFNLLPGDIVIVRANEVIQVPENLVIRVADKNSLIRKGLKIDAPHYHPGHKTNIFIRVQNLSDEIFTIQKDLKIAQLMFEELKEVPEVPYTMQENASFNDEEKYIGVGKYSNEYKKLSKRFEETSESMESLKEKLYSNVLSIMGIFVSIFTLISVNTQIFLKETISTKLIGTVNLCLLSSIIVLMGFIQMVIHKGKNKYFPIVYFIFALLIIGSTVAISIIK